MFCEVCAKFGLTSARGIQNKITDFTHTESREDTIACELNGQLLRSHWAQRLQSSVVHAALSGKKLGRKVLQLGHMVQFQW